VEKQKGKIRTWYEEHEEGVKKVGSSICDFIILGVGIGAACVLTDKITEQKIQLGLDRAYDEGFIKFFDPSSGNEVKMHEATKLLGERAKKK
jgi:hypothetical protein